MKTFALALLAVWLLTALFLFRTHPADEAAIRTIIVAAAYGLSYTLVYALVGLIRAVHRRIVNRKANLPTF